MFSLYFMKRACVLGATAFAVSLSMNPVTSAQPFPNKPVKIIVTAAPGGTTDISSRALSEILGKELGQSVIIENKAGGAGIIGIQALLAAPADGYTMAMGNIGPNAINYSLYKSLPYKMEDMEPITVVIANPNVLVVNPEVPAKTVAELVALAKANPGKYSFASSGRGQSIHMSGELFKTQAGIDIIHVPYKGAGPALADLLAGQTSMMVDNLPSSMQYIKAGKLRALAVTSKNRVAELPDVPTMIQAGYPNFEVTAWFGLFVPAGTPKPVIDKLYVAVKKALDSPEIKQRWKDLGGWAVGDTPANTKLFIAAEKKKWELVAQQAKIEAE
ncbi:tripartite tricarboxylate transporter substrate binding protein [Polynucleobacter sp. es-GGE-1]|jgi:tripartite-type tricarboxylate transporter receptor subunit TctC|uniref:Bug family tripartite tricarboxylate transporter substrate binding protein n=1 Tax=Polynucleobacter sp. es-GGE-1 TaxID=1819724 RepID=UPI001C0D697C|nr:tripartite tricarboxylate transporter substrate binding protein [Polynucleobacter sp. es-GGE-1]MBU3635096.1 tripartite tricarboxylate transporter substrate binding protein [Polynucleobacter sp. es-GGE-1]